MNVNQIKKMLESRADGIKRRRASELQNRLNEVKDMALEQRKKIMGDLAKKMEFSNLDFAGIKLKYKSHGLSSYDDDCYLTFTIGNIEYLDLINKRNEMKNQITNIYNIVEEEIDDLLMDLALHGATAEIAEKVKNLINN